MSGMLDDGAEGLAAIKAAGGRAVVQDPEMARHRRMPDKRPGADRGRGLCRRARDLAPTLLRMLAQPHGPPAVAAAAVGHGTREHEPGEPFTCPDCGGPIAVTETPGGLGRFRCLVGHKYSEASYRRAFDDARERTLWSADRLLHQHAILHAIRSDRARRHGDVLLAPHFDRLRGPRARQRPHPRRDARGSR